MAHASWTNNDDSILSGSKQNRRIKFVVVSLLLVVAVTFLVFNAMSGNTQLYKTVDEFYAEQDRLAGRDLRMAGVVVGDSIRFTQIDATTSRLEFDIVNDLANSGQRLHIVALNEPKPDLLQHEAHALVEGRVDENGIFMVNPGGLLLKCPTRYEENESF